MNKTIKISVILFMFLSICVISLYIDTPKNSSNVYLETTVIPRTTTYIPIESTPNPTSSTDIPIQTTISSSENTATPTEIPEANTYYVSTTGDDHNPGTLTAPWRTISHGVEKITAGDTLYIRGGMYQEIIEITVDGTASKEIVISGYSGEEVIIDGKGNTLPEHDSGAYLVKILGDYVTFSNMTIQDSGEHGIGVFGSHSKIAYLNIYGNWRRGAGLGGDYEVAEYLDVHDNSMVNYQGSTGQDPTALTAGRSPNYAIIRHCKVYRNWGIGLSTYESTHTIMEDNISYDNYSNNIYISDTTDVLFQRNLIYSTGFMDTYGGHPQTGIAVWDEIYQPASARITIINNIVYGTKYCLRWLSGPLKDGSGMDHIFIANNTFANSTEGSCIYFKDSPINTGTVFMNNIVIQENSLPLIYVSTNSNILFSNNLWSKAPLRAAQSPGDLIGNPMLAMIDTFVDPLWFQLLPNSPAIDHALILPEVTKDYWGIPRGTSPDIGAIEYIGMLSQAPPNGVLPEGVIIIR
jgi:Right handed beta helix region